jgi:hypothetical protein
MATGVHTGHMMGCPDINPDGCAKMPVPDEWHDLTTFISELRLHADYGITSWLSANLFWTLRLVHVGYQLEDAATMMPIAPPFGSDIFHHTETLIGLTDPWLSFRAATALGPWAFAFRLGVTLPVGATVPDPAALERAGKPSEYVQFGTGTVDPFAGMELRRTIDRFVVSGWLLGKTSLYENSYRYRAGSQLWAGANVSSALWTQRWWFMVGALVFDEQPERWSGLTESQGNLGRTDVMIDTAISCRFAGRWSTRLSARIPVYSQAAGGQLNTPAFVELGIARSIELMGR